MSPREVRAACHMSSCGAALTLGAPVSRAKLAQVFSPTVLVVLVMALGTIQNVLV